MSQSLLDEMAVTLLQMAIYAGFTDGNGKIVKTGNLANEVRRVLDRYLVEAGGPKLVHPSLDDLPEDLHALPEFNKPRSLGKHSALSMGYSPEDPYSDVTRNFYFMTGSADPLGDNADRRFSVVEPDCSPSSSSNSDSSSYDSGSSNDSGSCGGSD